MVVVQSCSQRSATYGICCMVAESISVICSEHSNWHGALDLALMLCTCLLGMGNITGISVYCDSVNKQCIPRYVFRNTISAISGNHSLFPLTA